MKMMFGLMAECANGLENLLAEPAKNEEILEVKGNSQRLTLPADHRIFSGESVQIIHVGPICRPIPPIFFILI